MQSEVLALLKSSLFWQALMFLEDFMDVFWWEWYQLISKESSKKIDISKKLSNLGIKLKFVLFSTFSLKNRLKCSTLAAAPSTSYT